MNNVRLLMILSSFLLTQNLLSQDVKQVLNNEKYEGEVKNARSEEQVKVERGTFIDHRDGHIYKTVKIGSKIWMAENLAYKAESGCWAYDNNNNNVNHYGYLYNWQTSKNVCPSSDGWHLPTKTEFETLLGDYGGDWTNSAYSALIQDGGFVAIPGGWRDYDGNYYDIGGYCYFWSASDNTIDNAWSLGVYSDHKEAGVNDYDKSWGFSVRCVHD